MADIRKAVIKNADMSEEMQLDAVDCGTRALEKYSIEKDVAAFIKKEFDKKYNPTWHCIARLPFFSSNPDDIAILAVSIIPVPIFQFCHSIWVHFK
ncbi:unnamed protein product (mitochondrion) [Plasmodiophora brassicae]|uniref:Dynein light chain n=1 Tax=Plasmodiophora brassicae TaxID=37360 RepID=A0A3P3Y5Y7_PLABS|nr:unnamed protein product [Plasmodiophora brassicae]